MCLGSTPLSTGLTRGMGMASVWWWQDGWQYMPPRARVDGVPLDRILRDPILSRCVLYRHFRGARAHYRLPSDPSPRLTDSPP